MSLKLKRGKTYTIPLLAGEFNSLDVMGLLDLALKGRRNRIVIESILDNPIKENQEEKTDQLPDATKKVEATDHIADANKKVAKKSKKKAEEDLEPAANGSVHQHTEVGIGDMF